MKALSEASGRLEQLIALRDTLACAIDSCESMRDLAALSRQYRETIREIEEIEGTEAADDEIGDILNRREADGESRAVRKDRSKIR